MLIFGNQLPEVVEPFTGRSSRGRTTYHGPWYSTLLAIGFAAFFGLLLWLYMRGTEAKAKAAGKPWPTSPSRLLVALSWGLTSTCIASTSLMVAGNYGRSGPAEARLPEWAFAGGSTSLIIGFAAAALVAWVGPLLITRGSTSPHIGSRTRSSGERPSV